MEYQKISFFKIVTFTFIAFILIYSLPFLCSQHVLERNISKQISIFNDKTALASQFNGEGHSIEIGPQFNYPLSKVKETFEEKGLDSDYLIKKMQQSHNDKWPGVITGKLVMHTLREFTTNIIKLNLWYFHITYIMAVFLGIFICYYLYKKFFQPVHTNYDFVDKLLGYKNINPTITAMILCFTSIGLGALSLIILTLNIPFLNDLSMLYGWELQIRFLLIIISMLGSFYFLYLFFHIAEIAKLKWLAKIIDIWIILSILIALLLILIDIGGPSIFHKSLTLVSNVYNIFFCDTMSIYGGNNRFIAFVLILLLFITLIICSIILEYKVFFPTKGVYRITYSLRYQALLLIIFFTGFTLKPRIFFLTRAINKQIDYDMLHYAIETSTFIDAETYQWYHQQKDKNRSTEIFPDALTKSAEKIKNIEFSKDWDGQYLKLFYKFEISSGDSIKLVNHKLNTESGEITFEYDTLIKNSDR